MDAHEYLGVLRRGLVFIVLGILLGLMGGAAVQSMEGPSYAATSRDLVTNKTSGDLAEWLQASSFTESRIASYVLVASSGLVLQPVIDELGLDVTVEDLSRQITVTAPPQTFIIEITATAASAELARDIANAVSAEFSDVVSNQLETTDGAPGEATPTPDATAGTPTPTPSTTKLPNGTVVPISKPIAPVRIVNIEEAALPTAPLPSNGGLLLVVGGVLGLALGLLAASLREAIDTRVRGPKDIAAVAHIPILGDIPADRAVWTTPLVARSGAGAPIAEAFRALRAHLDHLRVRDGRHSIVVTAAGPGQGSTTITANLAVALANTATSIVVVDADLRSSALSHLFGIHGALGLTDVLAGRTSLDSALHSSDGGRLTVLPSGGRPSNPGELLATPTMRELVAELQRRFDVVLFDTPAISTVTDAAVLGSFDSSTLLVLAEGTTTRPRLENALSLLASGGSVPVGIVLNTIPRRRPFGTRPARQRDLPVSAIAAEYIPRFVPRVAAQPAALEGAAPAELKAAPVTPAVAVEPTVEKSPVEPEVEKPPVEPKVEKQPSHLADPSKPARSAPPAPGSRPRTSRRASAPITSAPLQITASAEPAAPTSVAPEKSALEKSVPEKPVSEKSVPAKRIPKPIVDTAATAAITVAGEQLPTSIEHSLTSAKDLDFAFAALPTAAADAQRASIAPEPEKLEPENAEPEKVEPENAEPIAVERPIVVRPDPLKPASRFAPDPSKLVVGKARSAYATAPAPAIGTHGKVREPVITGTVVNTVSIRVQKHIKDDATIPPPIRHILPVLTTSTIPPKVIEAAARPDGPDTADTADRTPEREPEPVGVSGSLLGEIGGIQRVEVRAALHSSLNDSGPNPERQARESYEMRARDLERAAHDRLKREQERLAVSIREQLAHDKRELESVLDNRLEETVLRPVGLPPRRANDPRFSDPSDDDGQTR